MLAIIGLVFGVFFICPELNTVSGNLVKRECADQNTNCEYWAGIGECEVNAEYMWVYCKKSCKTCNEGTEDCHDNDDGCVIWAAEGECVNNTAYMELNCKLSCGGCEGVDGVTPRPQSNMTTQAGDDQTDYCKEWAQQGECQTNAGYMMIHCKHSCDLVGGVVG